MDNKSSHLLNRQGFFFPETVCCFYFVHEVPRLIHYLGLGKYGEISRKRFQNADIVGLAFERGGNHKITSQTDTTGAD
jgi:hypothetical protein